jgi:transposase-like protein
MGHGIRNAQEAHDQRSASLGELIHAHVRRAIEVAVDEELAAALAARPYERNATRRGYRNGWKARMLAGPTGLLPLTLPRATIVGPAGAHEWRSAIVPRYARRAPEVNAAVVATYLAGTNTRRIRGALAPLLKSAPLSKSAVSRVVATLRESLQTWMNRSLADVDGIVVYLDAIALRVRSAGRVVSLPVLGAVGVLADGRKQLLALECCGGESAAAWRGFVEELAHRGLAAPLLCIIDGNPGLRRALAEIWPTALVQRCCVHKLRNLERKAPKHALAELRDDFHRIVYAASGDTAGTEVVAFERKWAKRCPGVVRSLQEGGAELLTFFTFPRAQWKTLRTTNVLERLNGEFRRRVKTQSALPSEDTAVVLLFSLVASGQIRLRRIDGWRKIAAVLRQRARVAA